MHDEMSARMHLLIGRLHRASSLVLEGTLQVLVPARQVAGRCR